MALLWMDGFDIYGTSTSGVGEMLDGVWAAIDSNYARPSTAQARTGTHSFLVTAKSLEFFINPRRILGASYSKVGVGIALYLPVLPTNNSSGGIISWLTPTNAAIVSLGITPTGRVKIVPTQDIEGAAIAESADGAVVASAWQHVEALIHINGASSAVEARVNGVTVCSGTTTLGASLCAQIALGRTQSGASASYDFYVDDMYVYNDLGTENNDWMGDLRVKHIMPNDDTAQADWLKSSGSTGYTLIDEIPADDDTTYIYNEAFGDGGEVSEFELENLTGAIASIRGVQTYAKQRKTVAGTCNTEVSVVSGTSVSLGADRPITEAYTYWMDVHEVDPATGAPWTKDAINAMKLRIERTA